MATRAGMAMGAVSGKNESDRAATLAGCAIIANEAK